MTNNFIDISGKKFGKLQVICRSDGGKEQHRVYWECLCDCGKVTVAESYKIRRGITTSCGCVGKTAHVRHRCSGNRMYRIYQAMKQRCNNKTDKQYEDYGKRGIKVCEEWENDFINFKIWAEENGYSNNLTLDRIDVNGNYEPSNCRWVDMAVQENNRRNTRYLLYNGETHTLREWSEISGIKYTTLRSRYDRYGNNTNKIFKKEP